MDDFLEGTFSEDSNDVDNGEAEAALYSVVHHSEDTYDTNMLEFSGSYIHQRNSANRWEVFKQLGESVKPDSYILHSQEINQPLDHIPFSDNYISNKSRTMFGQQFNRRGRNVNHNWNNHRNEKPWNIHDRIRNNYQRNRNLVPVFVERNEVDQQYCVDPQAVLKINNFSSFERPGSNFQDGNLQKESNRKDVEFVEHNSRISGEGNMNNNISGVSQNRNMCNRTNSGHGLKVTEDYASASTSKETSVSIMAEVCLNDSDQKKSSILLDCNSKISAVEKNATKVVEVSTEIIEEVIISDTEGIDCSDESVVEVCAPPKPSPPVVALDSSDESENVDSKKSLILNVIEDKKLTIDNPPCAQITPVTSKSIKNPLFAISSTSKEIKKKKKKKRHKYVNSFECESWTAGMIKFYNKSWGGESYDHQKLQLEMTANPSRWKILDADKYGRVRDYGPYARVRCANCHQFGHMAKRCPDPRKIKCCTMCGERGHLENQCPNKICLKCGRPAPLFNEGCPLCWNHPQNCATCGGEDHFKWLCPDVWRKLHSVTTSEELEIGILNETTYKSPMDLNCCFCAGKGHLAAECRMRSKKTSSSFKTPPSGPFKTPPLGSSKSPPSGSSKTPPSGLFKTPPSGLFKTPPSGLFKTPPSELFKTPPSLDIFSTINILNKGINLKKRKKKRSYFFEGKNNQQEFNKKRRKTN